MRLPEISTIHDHYLFLCRVARERFTGTLGGRLLLRTGLDAAGIAQIVAANIAGGASLCVDADGAVLREGLRAGLCDFVVGDLDEALRILKNEVRRGLPVAVCLTADPAECGAAMAERGVQPDLLMMADIEARGGMGAFLERGAVMVPGDEVPDVGTSLLGWSVAKDAVRVMPRISRVAAVSLDASRADTPARRQWLELAPRYLGRAFGARQCVRATELEVAPMIAAIRAEFSLVEITKDGATP